MTDEVDTLTFIEEEEEDELALRLMREDTNLFAEYEQNNEDNANNWGIGGTAASKSYIGGSSEFKHGAFNSTDTEEQPSSVSEVLVCCWDVPGALADLNQTSGWEHVPLQKENILKIIANYMVLLGDGEYFIYSTTKNYVESTWGAAGLTALRLFATAIDKTMFGSKTARDSEFPFETQYRGKNYVHFQLLSGTSEQQHQALRWLCAVVRRPPSSEPGTPMMKGRPNGYHNFVWGIAAEESRRPDGISCYDLSPWSPSPRRSRSPGPSCWTDLFATSVIMECAIRRNWGKGIELSFSMMIALAGVENIYCIGGGYLLLGFFTALVPVGRHERTNSIQWHLEVHESGINPRRLECIKQYWFRTTDIKMLREARCFVGWFEKAHIMLGTRQLATDEARTLRWTGLRSRKMTLRHVGHELGVQSGLNIGPINIVGQGISTFAITSNKLRYTAPQQFAQVLRLDSRKVALVVDVESRRAWLVPLLSWILHLCHRYYIEQCGHGTTPIPFAEPSSDGAKAALSAVEDKGSTVIFGAGTEDAETLRQLWLRIGTNLTTSQPGHEDPGKGLIFAAEAMDITMSPQDSFPSEVPFSGASASWAEFAKLATTTVCANLGNAIVPVPPSGKLCECCVLLERQNFLAAHTWSLARLLQRKGRTLSQLKDEGLPFENGTCWRVSDGLQGLWTDCPAGDECRNIWGENASKSPILQRLEKIDRQRSEGNDVEEEPPVYDDQESEAGVVVFGGYPESKGVISMPGLLRSLNARFGSMELFPQRGVAGN